MVTVHTPNTGAMLGVSTPGIRIWLRDTCSTTRKYRYSWEISEPQENVFVGVHTGLVNALVCEAIRNGTVSELQGFEQIQQEVRYGEENSRIDLLLENDRQRCFVEIKNVTARDAQNYAIFPDAVSVRGQKHLRELMRVVEAGHRGVIFYCIQRGDIDSFRPAAEIDQTYARLLGDAIANGVEVLAYKAHVSPFEIFLNKSVTIQI